MTPPLNLPADEITRAAQWLADLREPPYFVVPFLKERFGLSSLQACEALEKARKMQLLRRVHG